MTAGEQIEEAIDMAEGVRKTYKVGVAVVGIFALGMAAMAGLHALGEEELSLEEIAADHAAYDERLEQVEYRVERAEQTAERVVCILEKQLEGELEGQAIVNICRPPLFNEDRR